MLTDLTLDNVGVIRHACAQFSPHFTVLTGETGAGKTMLISGLKMLSGARADASKIRVGASELVVEGCFQLSSELLASDTDGHSVAQQIDDCAAAVDDGHLVTVRSIKADKPSKAHVGGRTVPVSTLGKLVSTILTIHGQHDQLRLLSPAQQLSAVDGYGDAKHQHSVAELAGQIAHCKKLHQEYEYLVANGREMQQQADGLRASIAEIDEAKIAPGDEELLRHQISMLMNAEAIRADSTAITSALRGEHDGGMIANLGQLAERAARSDDADIKELADSLSQASELLSHIATEAGLKLADLPEDDSGIDELMMRQQTFRHLFKKYAADIEGVLGWREEAERKLAIVDTSDDKLVVMREQLDTALARAITLDDDVHAARQKLARELAAAVTGEIEHLGMKGRTFEIVVDRIPTRDEISSLSSQGSSSISFALVQAGQQVPLTKGASGGELSRIMLAIEVVLAEDGPRKTIVFDEVDSGVGGESGLLIGQRLAKLAQHHQVIVITHLPQVAAFADTHLRIVKQIGDSDDTALTHVEELDDAAAVSELARMLAGVSDSSSAKEHAQELVHQAAQFKQSAP